MKKIVMILLLAVAILSLQATPLWAWGEVKKAKQSLDMGHYDIAYSIIMEFIKDKPADLDANFQLGRYHLLTGNDSVATELFSRIIRMDKSFQALVGDVFQEIIDIESRKSQINCGRIYNLLVQAYSYNPKLALGASSRIIAFGDTALKNKQYAYAEGFYVLAERYSSENISEKIAHKFLYLAYLGYKTEELKAKAAKVVGKDFVARVFPGTKTITVFEKTYTNDDAFEKEHGQIYTVSLESDGVRVGDTMEIIANVIGRDKFSGDEIGRWRGKNFSPNWAMTKNGYLKEEVGNVGKGLLMISLNSRKDVKVTVRVTRMVNLHPNVEILVSFL